MGTIVTPLLRMRPGRTEALSRATKTMFWAAIVGLAGWYIYANALRFLMPEPAARASYGDNAFALVLHVLGGVAALLMGPLQFSAALRRSRPRLHRVIGRVYLAAIGVGAVSAIYLLLRLQRNLGFETGIYGLASAWLLTSGMALTAIRLRQIDQHREWMIRSYVVTFGFVVFRIGHDLLMAWEVAPRQQITGSMAWLCWAAPLLITEVVLQGRKLLAAARVQGRRPLVAPAATPSPKGASRT